MGRMVKMLGLLGDDSTPAISVAASPGAAVLTWYVPPSFPDPVTLWVSVDGAARTPQTQGRGGVEPTNNWTQPGHVYRWDMTFGPDDTLAESYTLDLRNGFPGVPTDQVLATAPAPSLPPPVGSTVALPATAVPAAGVSWFDQSSLIAGVPNMYIAGAAALLAVVILKKKKSAGG